MRAACYEKQGPGCEVLSVGERPDLAPRQGEVRIRIAALGVNPGDVKKRQDFFGYGVEWLDKAIVLTTDGSAHDEGDRAWRRRCLRQSDTTRKHSSKYRSLNFS